VPLVVYILGLTIFSLTTSEFMVAGMMPSLTVAFGVSVEQIGYLISLYALGMVVGGPVLTASLIKLKASNKSALLWLLGFYAIAHSIAALAGSYAVLAVIRVVTGMVGAACFGASLAICAEVVAPEVRGRAASVVLGGLMLAAAAGVPIATLLDQHMGWRASFWLVAILTILCAAMIAKRVPPVHSLAPINLSTELVELRSGYLWASYATSALIIGATFSAFSYFAPILTEVSGFSSAAIPLLLGGYGLANIVGNTVVGRYADKYTLPVLLGGLSLLTIALMTFALFAHSPMVSVAMVLVIGLVGVTMNPAMVARVMRTAKPGPLVNTLHSSIINIGLGMGAWLGGVGIGAGYGMRSPLWVGVALATLGLVSLIPFLGSHRIDAGLAAQH